MFGKKKKPKPAFGKRKKSAKTLGKKKRKKTPQEQVEEIVETYGGDPQAPAVKRLKAIYPERLVSHLEELPEEVLSDLYWLFYSGHKEGLVRVTSLLRDLISVKK